MFDLHFDPQALVNVLPVLGKGILGVFAVICAIWALVAIMNRNAGYITAASAFGVAGSGNIRLFCNRRAFKSFSDRF